MSVWWALALIVLVVVIIRWLAAPSKKHRQGNNSDWDILESINALLFFWVD